MTGPVDFGSRAIEYVEHVLKQCQLNPSQLAQKAGLEPSSLNRPLNSTRYRGALSLTTIGKIANATHVDPSPFLTLGERCGLVVIRSDPVPLPVLERLRRRSGMSMRELAEASGFSGQSSIQRYLSAEYAKGLRPEIAERFVDALIGRGDPPITAFDLRDLISGKTVQTDDPALTDLLGFLHFLRAERGVDVPERHFETLRALTTSKNEGAANG